MLGPFSVPSSLHISGLVGCNSFLSPASLWSCGIEQCGLPSWECLFAEQIQHKPCIWRGWFVAIVALESGHCLPPLPTPTPQGVSQTRAGGERERDRQRERERERAQTTCLSHRKILYLDTFAYRVPESSGKDNVAPLSHLSLKLLARYFLQIDTRHIAHCCEQHTNSHDGDGAVVTAQ